MTFGVWDTYQFPSPGHPSAADEVWKSILCKWITSGRQLQVNYFDIDLKPLGQGLWKPSLTSRPLGQDLVKALLEPPAPTNIGQLRWLRAWSTTYYSQFIQNLSTLADPMYCLKQNNVPRKWVAPKRKQLLSSLTELLYQWRSWCTTVLMHCL